MWFISISKAIRSQSVLSPASQVMEKSLRTLGRLNGKSMEKLWKMIKSWKLVMEYRQCASVWRSLNTVIRCIAYIYEAFFAVVLSYANIALCLDRLVNADNPYCRQVSTERPQCVCRQCISIIYSQLLVSDYTDAALEKAFAHTICITDSPQSNGKTLAVKELHLPY
jgi:hypothetical protein